MTRTRRPNQSTPSVAATQVETSAQPTRHGLPITGTLRLRAEATTTTEEAPAEERRIRWAEDVVDNEGQGKKSSKVCCIYHKPRAVGESSSESDSSESDSSESDSDSGVDNGEARMANGRSSKRRLHKHHDHNHDDDSHSGHNRKPAKRKPKVNAYERVPKHNTKKAEDTQRQT